MLFAYDAHIFPTFFCSDYFLLYFCSQETFIFTISTLKEEVETKNA